jgi:hypothetical protein
VAVWQQGKIIDKIKIFFQCYCCHCRIPSDSTRLSISGVFRTPVYG